MKDFVVIPPALEAQAEAVAHVRLTTDSYYSDKLGKTSKHQLPYTERYAEELRSICAQLALQLCLELPVFQPTSMAQARRVGNAGGGHSAQTPKQENLGKNYHLIVDPDELDEITHWLVIPVKDGWWLEGYMKAAEAKTYPLKDWIRPDSGLRSVSHWVPHGAVHSDAEGLPRGVYEYCEKHHSYFCPCARPHLYKPPFTRSRTDETAEALAAWDTRWSG